jgi:prepilin-type N-terminal cleavage/methylation domain-containing protein
MTSLNAKKGFTLAELLIALAILGLIAAFTIPKVLTSTGNGKLQAVAKEVISMVSGAHQSYINDNGQVTTMPASALTTYMNYVAVNSTNTTNNGTSLDCSTSNCLQLHNGAFLQYNGGTFGSTTTALVFNVDTDGTGSNTNIMSVLLSYNGRIAVGTTTSTGFTGGTGILTASASPSWFSW